MSYTVLARRYRSGTFDEVVGQEHVAGTLKRAISSGRIAHAYLFCGTRGVGKTSMARILAKALNCEKADSPTTEPCGVCASCQAIARGDDIDVIEIDAASNTGVDDIRDLIENSRYRPARGRFKIYIIDEVHMLSKNAFNALLKTLEEPPSHVKFILATTEPEKVLPTILSRCQRYVFRNIPTREIAAHLANICHQEGVKTEEDALLLVARAGAGSMRDALSLLDRLLSLGDKTLSSDGVERLLGLPPAQRIFDLATAIGEGDVAATLSRTDELINSGLSADSLIASLVDHLRNLLVLRVCGLDSKLVEAPGISAEELAKQAQAFDPAALPQDIAMLEELRRQMRQSQAGRALLDAVLARLTMAEQYTAVADLLARLDGVSPSPASAAQKKKPELSGSPPTKTAAIGTAVTPAAKAAPTIVAEDDDDDLPRPGKVWETGGPDLATLLKQHSGAGGSGVAQPPSAVLADEASALSGAGVPPASQKKNADGAFAPPADLLAQMIARLPPATSALIEGCRLERLDAEEVILAFPASHSSSAALLERNGRKNQVRDALADLLGRKIALRITVDAAPEAPSPPPRHKEPAAAPPPRPAAHAPVPEPPAGPILTAELRQKLMQDPLIAAAAQSLGAQLIKLE